MPSVPGTVNYPAALDDAVSLIDAGNNLGTTLAADIGVGATTIQPTSTTGWPTTGMVTIIDPVAGNEIISYNGIVGGVLQSVLKGQQNTSDLAHLAVNVTSVELRPTARHHTALRDAIIAAQTELGVGARMSPLFNQRSGPVARARVLPTGDFGCLERLWIGNGSFEVPATSSITVYDTPAIPSKILAGGVRNVVRDYGATAYPDVAQAVNQAISDASSDGGGIVEVPMASTAPMSVGLVWPYYNLSQIRMKSNVWLRGQGLGTQLRSIASNPNAAMIVLDNPNVTQTMVSDISLFGGSNQATAHCLLYDNTGGSGTHRLYRIYVFGGFQDGIHWSNAGSGHLLDVVVQGVQGNGFVFDSNATDNSLFDCEAGQCGLAGFVDMAAFNRYTTCKAFLSGAVTASLGDGFRISPFNAFMIRCEAQSNRNHGFSWVQSGGTQQWADAVGLEADSNAGDAFHFDGAVRSRVSGIATFGNPDGIGPHANIVGFVNAPSQNTVEVSYDTTALIAGGAPVAGAYTNSDVHVRQLGARMDAALTLSLRSDTYGAMVVPQNADYGVLERLVVGANSSIEVPATSSLTVYNVS